MPSQAEILFGGQSFTIDAWVRAIQCGPTFPATIVDKLDTAGLILRHPHPRDTRFVMIELSPEGVAASKQLIHAARQGVPRHAALALPLTPALAAPGPDIHLNGDADGLPYT